MENPIGRALREAMDVAGWSKTKVAYTVGVSENSVHKWLHGHAIPRGDKIEVLRAELPGFAQRLDAIHGTARAS